jgi:hypothetical protein
MTNKDIPIIIACNIRIERTKLKEKPAIESNPLTEII